MQSPRICHLSKYYPPAPGGIETHVRTLAQAQAAMGASVKVFCVNHASRATVVEHDGPVEVTRFGRLASAAKIDVCPGLARSLARVDADILHMQVPNPTMILAMLAGRPKPPMVVTYQSDVVRQRLRAVLFRPAERWAYHRVRLILASSPAYVEGSKFLRPYADRIECLPNGIDLDPYLDRLRPEASRPRPLGCGRGYKGPLWLACGRMVYYKGFLNAIHALAAVPGTLLLIGGGPDRCPCVATARPLRSWSVADRAVFLGNLPHYLDLIPYYLAADAFWFPSNARSEAFGLVQVEAMASGCPVINAAIPHSGVPWVSPHEETGLTVAVDDPAALAAAARRLLDEPGLRGRLAAAAQARAAAEFDHRVMARRSLEMYRRVLGGTLQSTARVFAPEVANTRVFPRTEPVRSPQA